MRQVRTIPGPEALREGQEMCPGRRPHDKPTGPFYCRHCGKTVVPRNSSASNERSGRRGTR
jgi:hypothetical protein